MLEPYSRVTSAIRNGNVLKYFQISDQHNAYRVPLYTLSVNMFQFSGFGVCNLDLCKSGMLYMYVHMGGIVCGYLSTEVCYAHVRSIPTRVPHLCCVHLPVYSRYVLDVRILVRYVFVHMSAYSRCVAVCVHV